MVEAHGGTATLHLALSECTARRPVTSHGNDTGNDGSGAVRDGALDVHEEVNGECNDKDEDEHEDDDEHETDGGHDGLGARKDGAGLGLGRRDPLHCAITLMPKRW